MDRSAGHAPAGRLGVPLAIVALAVVWAGLAARLPVGGPEGPGPVFVPLLLAVGLAVLGLVLLLQTLRRPAHGAPTGPGWGQAGRVLGLLALYLAALVHVGYAAATAPFVAAAMVLCGARAPLLVAGTALGFTLAVWAVLTVLFGVPLPRGPWS